jgi:hypothetical protein
MQGKIIPSFLRYSKQDLISTQVAPDPMTGLPLDRSKGEQKGHDDMCDGFDDVLGVLHSYKPCSMVSYLMLKHITDAVPKKSFMCAGKLVPGGSKFYEPLLRACDEHGLKCFKKSNSTLIVYRPDTVRYAAGLFLLYYGGIQSDDLKLMAKATAKIMKVHFQPFDFDYVTALLLGYDHEVARSLYHSRMLETCLLDQGEDGSMLKRGTPAHKFATKFVKIHSAWFDKWAEGCRQRMYTFLDSPLVSRTAKNIAAKSHPLSKWYKQK